MSTTEEKNNKIGALWENEKGYMSGNIEIGGQKINIICFPSTKKTKTTSPDWNILLKIPAKPKEDEKDKEF